MADLRYVRSSLTDGVCSQPLAIEACHWQEWNRRPTDLDVDALTLGQIDRYFT